MTEKGPWQRVKQAYRYPRLVKGEAITAWDKRAGEEFERAERARKSGAPDAALKHFLYKSNALAYYGAGAAAGLAAETWQGWALDLASMLRGGYTTKVGMLVLRGARGARVLRNLPRTHKGLKAGETLAKAWSTRGSKLFKARKAIKLGSVAARNLGLPEGTAKGPPRREPFVPIAAQIKPELEPTRRRHRVSQARATTPSYTQLDMVKFADWSLRASPHTNPIPQTAIERQRTRDWLRGVQGELARGHLTRSIDAHRAMERRYGVDALAQRSRISPRTTARMSVGDLRALQQSLGMKATRARPLLQSNPLRALSSGLG